MGLGKGNNGRQIGVIAVHDIIRQRGDAGIVGFHVGKEPGPVSRTHDRLGDGVFPGAVADQKDIQHGRFSCFIYFVSLFYLFSVLV